jgi:hypothetical protein
MEEAAAGIYNIDRMSSQNGRLWRYQHANPTVRLALLNLWKVSGQRGTFSGQHNSPKKSAHCLLGFNSRPNFNPKYSQSVAFSEQYGTFHHKKLFITGPE